MKRFLLPAFLAAGVLILGQWGTALADGSISAIQEQMERERLPEMVQHTDDSYTLAGPIETGSLPNSGLTETLKESYRSPHVDIFPGGPITINIQ